MERKEVRPDGSKNWGLQVRHRNSCVLCVWAKVQGQTRAEKLSFTFGHLVLWKIDQKQGTVGN